MKTPRILIAALLLAQVAEAQAPVDFHLRRLLAVPVGALPPMGMLMLASRNHNYWVGRVQAGTQLDNFAGDRAAFAGGIDLQWRGGSVFGVTAGYQTDCDESVIDCTSHSFFGARARFNIITGGPTVAALVGDNSASTTLGAEIGLGYAPNSVAGRNACALDFGLPISVSLFQRVRVLSFFSPGIAWDMRCPAGGSRSSGASAFLGAGLGLQQIFHRGLDVSFGVQRIVRRDAGIQLGVNVTYVRLP
jgi:hypothetical protein